MKVSVVIPCYNAALFLGATLDSVFSQTQTGIEVIVVDDGSTDGTTGVLRAYANRVKVIHGEHRGASAARNAGTRLASGEYIQYLDADDLLRADAIEHRVTALTTSGADVAYSDWQRLEEDENGRYRPGETERRRIEDVHSDPEIALFSGFWAPPAALLYRRRIVDAIGGWNESLPVIQDARFLLDAALKGAVFVHVAEVGADYRVHRADSLSRRDPVAFVYDVYRNTCQVQEVWQARGRLRDAQRRALLDNFDYVARTLFQHDAQAFEDTIGRMRALEPVLRIGYPKIAAALARLFGYAIARRLLGWAATARRHAADGFGHAAG